MLTQPPPLKSVLVHKSALKALTNPRALNQADFIDRHYLINKIIGVDFPEVVANTQDVFHSFIGNKYAVAAIKIYAP